MDDPAFIILWLGDQDLNLDWRSQKPVNLAYILMSKCLQLLPKRYLFDFLYVVEGGILGCNALFYWLPGTARQFYLQ